MDPDSSRSKGDITLEQALRTPRKARANTKKRSRQTSTSDVDPNGATMEAEMGWVKGSPSPPTENVVSPETAIQIPVCICRFSFNLSCFIFPPSWISDHYVYKAREDHICSEYHVAPFVLSISDPLVSP
jgi:hypothetical protein